MKEYVLSLEEQVATGYSHKFVVTYDDLDGTADTSLTINLKAYTAGTQFQNAGYRIRTAFDGGATSALTLKLGYNGATTDNDDGLIEAIETHADGTEILYAGANGADFATKLMGYTALDAGYLTALFTATGANLTALTTGEIHIFVKIVDLTKY